MMIGSNAERAKDLAYRLYTIAEQKKWATEAYAYNALVVAWPDIQSRAAMMQREKPEQMDMFAMGLLEDGASDGDWAERWRRPGEVRRAFRRLDSPSMAPPMIRTAPTI